MDTERRRGAQLSLEHEGQTWGKVSDVNVTSDSSIHSTTRTVVGEIGRLFRPQIPAILGPDEL